MIVMIFYAICFGVNLLIFVNFICRKEYQGELNFFIAFALLLRSYGQLMVAGSKSLDMAVFAHTVFYFGTAFLPTFLFLALARLAKVKLPAIMELGAVAYSTVILVLAANIGKSDLYYSKVYLVIHREGYSTLEKVYGPLHVLYYIMMVAYAIGFMYLFIRTYKNKNAVSKHMITLVSHLATLIIVLYIVGTIVHPPVPLTSIVYLVATLISIKVMSDSEMHDLTGCVLESMNENDEDGVVVFDNEENYINANEKARQIYPEINSLTVGKKVEESDGDFYTQVARRVKEANYGLYKPEDQSVVAVGNNKYDIRLSDIVLRSGDKSAGTFVEIEDVTLKMNIAEVEAKYSKELEEDVRKKEVEIRDMQNRLVLGLATLVESRNSSTGEHIVRTLKGVKVFVEQLKKSKELDLSESFLDMVRMATPMHDLGKIAIDNEILMAKNKTPEQEDAIVRLHTEEGTKIVRKVLAGIGSTPNGNKFTNIAVLIANYHHERWDGSGLPSGLRGKEIPLEARIVAFIDALDMMTEDETGTRKMSFKDAFDSIVNKIGIWFDPELGVEFVKCRQELEKIYEEKE